MRGIVIKAGLIGLVSNFGAPLMAAADDMEALPSEEADVQLDVESYGAAFAIEGAPMLDHAAVTAGSPKDDSKDEDSMAGLRAKVREVCTAVQATEDQKTQIRDAVFNFKETAIPLAANLRVAKLKYIQNALATAGTEAAATATAKDAVAIVDQLAQLKSTLATKILFGVLKADQRGSGLRCMAAIKRVKEAHRGCHHGM